MKKNIQYISNDDREGSPEGSCVSIVKVTSTKWRKIEYVKTGKRKTCTL